MSSDLWQAFGDPGVVATNPWAQPVASTESALNTEEPKNPDSSGHHVDIWDTDISHTQQLHPPVEPTEEAAHSEADSWSAVNEDLENAWYDSAKKPESSITSGVKQSKLPAVNLQYDEDDFGDFEDAELQAPVQEVESSNPNADSIRQRAESLRLMDDFGAFEEPDTDTLRSTNGSVDLFSTSPPSTKARALSTQVPQGLPASKFSTTYDPFADLEQLSRPTLEATKSAAQPGPQAPKRPESVQQTPKPEQGDLKSPVKVAKSKPVAKDEASKHPALNLYDAMIADEEWDDFPDEPDRESAPDHQLNPTLSNAARGTSRSKPASRIQSKPVNAIPPSNVPPPSILMSLIAGLVQRLPDQIEEIIKSHGQSPDPKATELCLLGCLGTLRVTARVTAGRKLRWKRDTILSQSMKIGPAGKSGGMKLVGVDKAEVKREDREAAELVRTWQQNSGSIRAAITKAHGITDKPLSLPQIAESMMVRILKPEAGGVKATKCCVLCGLRRDERVDKVDVDVWDQFGEWWTEYWGHAECRIFWETHEQYLQQR